MHPRDSHAEARIEQDELLIRSLAIYFGRVIAQYLSELTLPRAPKRVRDPWFVPPVTLVGRAEGIPHFVVYDPATNRYRCTYCWSSSKHRWELAKQPCPMPHGTGHVVRRVGQVVFCRQCGAHSSTNVSHLTRLCLKRPSSDIQRYRLQRLMDGRHPRTEAKISDFHIVGSAFQVKFVLAPSRDPGCMIGEA